MNTASVKLVQQVLLFFSLLKKGQALCHPVYVDLDISAHCNLNCPGCPFHSPLLESPAAPPDIREDMDYETVIQLLDDLTTMSTREIVLAGEGEPMMHGRFFDIVEEAKLRKFNITLYTNGTLLNEKRANALVECGLDKLKISMWASNATTYQKNYPGTRADQFNSIIDGIINLGKIKQAKHADNPKIFIHFPLSRSNYAELETILDLAISLKVDGVTVAPVFSVTSRMDSLQIPAEQTGDIIKYLEKIEVKLNQAGIKHNLGDTKVCLKYGNQVWKTMPCYIGYFHAKIRVDGTIQPCCRCNVSIGNLSENSFREIWDSNAYRKLRQNMRLRDNFARFVKNQNCTCVYCSAIPNNYKIFRFDRIISRTRI